MKFGFGWFALAVGLTGAAMAAQAQIAFKQQPARDWSVSCRENGYCIARTVGASKRGAKVTLKLERSGKAKSKIFITVRPKSPALKVGMPVEVTVVGHEFTLNGPVKKVYKGNEMTFPVSFKDRAIDKLRVGRFAQIRIGFGGKAGVVTYDLSIQGVSSALAMMDIAQGRLDREDAAVVRGGEYFGAVSYHDFSAIKAPAKPQSDEKSSEILDPEHSLSEGEDDAPRATAAEAPPEIIDEESGLGETMRVFSEKKIDDKVLIYGYRTLGCDLPAAIRAFGAQSINLEPGVFLHLVPCQVADLNVPYYAVMETAGRFKQVAFQHSSAEDGADPSFMINAAWDKKSSTLTGHQFYSPNRDCGSFERHSFSFREQAFYLQKFRQKETCDGKVRKPERFPVSWSGEGD
ncbi:MAG: DUF1176 domain-containing protein [Filomicrobium sp.]